MPPDEEHLSLRQADQIRGDLYGIQDDLDFIKVQLARLPTRNEVWRAAMLGMLGGASGHLDRGICAIRPLGHADLLEPYRDRLALRDRVHSHARVIRPANFPCRVVAVLTLIEALSGHVSEPRYHFRWAACFAALAPSLASAREYRSSTVKHEFQRQQPCPSTGRTTGACPGYIKDHIRALACGGPDSVENLQWQTTAEAKAKDKWERKGCGR